MTTATEILREGFDRVHQALPGLIDDLGAEALLWRPDAGANPVGWLVWHFCRVQDDHLAKLSGRDQVWLVDGWADRFGLPYDRASIGFGQSAEEVGAFGVTDTGLLLGYQAPVHELTVQVLGSSAVDDLERVVDDAWDPPVTAGARLVSVINDITQHLGQIGYLNGLYQRR